MPKESFDPEEALKEIENLESLIKKIDSDLQQLKLKVQSEKISQHEHLDIIVTDIEQLDKIVRDRSDVGH